MAFPTSPLAESDTLPTFEIRNAFSPLPSKSSTMLQCYDDCVVQNGDKPGKPVLAAVTM